MATKSRKKKLNLTLLHAGATAKSANLCKCVLGLNDDSDHLLEDEACLQGRYGAREKVVNGGGLGGYPHVRHVAAPPGCTMDLANEDTHEELWVQPGDIKGFKSQIIKLLKLNGGRLCFGKIGA